MPSGFSLAPGVVSLAPLTEALSAYLPQTDIKRVREAYRFSDHAHLGQFRSSGEPYISHPLEVAQICAEWHLDADALMAALLHDVMEDSGVRKDELIERFGPTVANLVDGLSKLDKVEFQDREQRQAENFRKMLLAMARDIRVVMIKLADRLHNMRTLDAVPAHKRRRISKETLDIYAPIAMRLGLTQLHDELQELCFSHVHAMRYRVLRKAVLAARGNRRELLGAIVKTIRDALPEHGVVAEVDGREKSIYSIYRKMVDKHLSFRQIHDVYGFRILVDSIPSCYLALGALHALYNPKPGRFKDYIALPKENGYQSLHTSLVGPYGTTIECQIRTHDMHRVAEAGVAAHWIYKSAESSYSELQRSVHQWLQSLVDLQKSSHSPGEFMEHVKVDLFPDAVFVFTPKGDIRSLPRGATVVDFAYSVHTDVGNRCIGARVNGEEVSLKSEMRSGDIVEILTSADATPSTTWLGFVKTGKARSEIRHFVKSATLTEVVALGQQLLDHSLTSLNLPPLADQPDSAWDRALNETGVKTRQELLADIGLGKRMPALIARMFAQRVQRPGKKALSEVADRALDLSATALLPQSEVIEIRGNEGMAIHFAPCCLPIPGDSIIGNLRGGHGLSIHRDGCIVAKRQQDKEPHRWIPVRWSDEVEGSFSARLEVQASDHRGLLGRVAAEIAASDANIVNVTMETDTGREAHIQFVLQVSDRIHMARLIRNVRRVTGVRKVIRVRQTR